MNNLGLTIVKAPNGRYAYAGRVHSCLGEIADATLDDCRAARAWVNGAGCVKTWTFQDFASEEDAVVFAKIRGFEDTRSAFT